MDREYIRDFTVCVQINAQMCEQTYLWRGNNSLPDVISDRVMTDLKSHV